MEIGDSKTTFGSRLKEKRKEKGWSQYYLAALSGCTNSNISYLESQPRQRPKLETVEALAAVLDWPINEARRLAGYSERDDNLTPAEIESDFRHALAGYKRLSGARRELVKKQIARTIEFAADCERKTGRTHSSGRQTEESEVEKVVTEDGETRRRKK